MASILFKGGYASKELLEEVRSALCSRISVLNQKRKEFTKKRFAMVYITEVLVHPRTGESVLLVSFSDRDKNTPRFVRRALRSFGKSLETITQNQRI